MAGLSTNSGFEGATEQNSNFYSAYNFTEGEDLITDNKEREKQVQTKPASLGYYAMSGTNFKKNQKFRPQWTTPFVLNLFYTLEFTVVSIILPDFLSSITHGILLPFLSFITNPVGSPCSENIHESSWLSLLNNGYRGVLAQAQLAILERHLCKLLSVFPFFHAHVDI